MKNFTILTIATRLNGNVIATRRVLVSGSIRAETREDIEGGVASFETPRSQVEGGLSEQVTGTRLVRMSDDGVPEVTTPGTVLRVRGEQLADVGFALIEAVKTTSTSVTGAFQVEGDAYQFLNRFKRYGV